MSRYHVLSGAAFSGKAAFLAAYRETAGLSAAAKAAGIPATQHYERLERDQRYWQAFAEVQQEVASALYDEVLELAFYGRAEPVLYRGRQVGVERHSSDRPLLLLLKAGKPEQYIVTKPKTLEVPD